MGGNSYSTYRLALYIVQCYEPDYSPAGRTGSRCNESIQREKQEEYDVDNRISWKSWIMARIRFPANVMRCDAMRCDATSDIQLWISNPNTNKRAYLSPTTEKVPRMRPLWQELSISPLILLACSMYCKASPDFKPPTMWQWNNQSICPNSPINIQLTVYTPNQPIFCISLGKKHTTEAVIRLSFHSYS